MKVSFKRTGVRRYAVIVSTAGEPPRAMDPAPGYDDDIPHDLVHYVVEAELGFTHGVYGRAARGAGAFITTAARDVSPREQQATASELPPPERSSQSPRYSHATIVADCTGSRAVLKENESSGWARNVECRVP